MTTKRRVTDERCSPPTEAISLRVSNRGFCGVGCCAKARLDRRRRLHPMTPKQGVMGTPAPVPTCAGELGERFAEFAAEDFSGGGAGNRFHEVNFAGLFVVGEAVGDESAE